MDFFSNLALGFGVALTPINLLVALVGCVLGTLIGVLPRIGPVATIAMLLPATYNLQPVSALIMLASIYYGAQYGRSTTTILVNPLDEPSLAVTFVDGHQMTRQGRAGLALAAAGLGSFFAGCVGTLILAAFATTLTRLAFQFGPVEYFSLMVLGMVGAAVMASGSLIKAIAIMTRWRMPPESWCGNSVIRCSTDAIPTLSSMALDRSYASSSETALCTCTASTNCIPIV